jgi:hypothetical protein
MTHPVTGEDTDDQNSVLYGVVRFEPGEDRRVRDTTIVFDAPAAAELFAVDSGWCDYQVVPVFVVVDPVTAPVTGRILLGVALARSMRRADGP